MPVMSQVVVLSGKTKKCKCCKQVKPITEFYPEQARCKSCGLKNAPIPTSLDLQLARKYLVTPIINQEWLHYGYRKVLEYPL